MVDEKRSESRARVLVVEDEEIIREILLKTLDEEGYHVDAVETGEDALKALDSQLYDLVLLDLNLPGMHGLNVLAAAPAVQTDAQFIVMTAFGTVDTAVEAMKLGAYDYINKPFRTEELLMTLERAREEADLRREVAQLRRQAGEGMQSRIVGRTAAMQRLFDMIERVAPTRATVLVVGETGTGKELVARAIHDLSDRARRPFVAVNCSALPESLLESELFGHMKGSFTGAIQNKRGLFEEASGGTLFLDEISTVSAAIQVKLLRVLQERKIKRVGGRETVAVDFRLLAATNVDLAKLVEEDGFREDLFYRLNVFPIMVPPLRERREDIPLLANHFRLRFAEENGIEPPELPPETLSRMMAYARSIPFDPPHGVGRRPERELLTRSRDDQWDLERLEREYILEILEETHWHQGEASEILGINRRTLYRKLRKYREEGLLPEARMANMKDED
jgi:DNA-binding NtrC family response regulator